MKTQQEKERRVALSVVSIIKRGIRDYATHRKSKIISLEVRKRGMIELKTDYVINVDSRL